MRRLFYNAGAQFWVIWDTETGRWTTRQKRPTDLYQVYIESGSFDLANIQQLLQHGYTEQYIIPPELRVSEGL